ncbi:hypothetical protein V6N12_058578 [Hibiscus sabdariffa]|uniref:Uncharacterized protein n=1 Tax=Hibiscus sabdariffa TaxID=183260 RepID=A0ABR2ESJ2_9ROSI
MEETKVFRTSLINFLCFQFPSAAAFFSTPPTTEQPAPATAQPTPPADPFEGACNTEQLNLSDKDIFDWHTPMEHQSQLKQADILGSPKAKDAPAPAEPLLHKKIPQDAEGKRLPNGSSSATVPPAQNSQSNNLPSGRGSTTPSLLTVMTRAVQACQQKTQSNGQKNKNQSDPLEVPGNRLPETGSRRTLLPARASTKDPESTQAENSSTCRDTYLGRQGKYNRECDMISIFFQTPLDQERVKPRPKTISRADSKPKHTKSTWSTSLSREKSCFIKITSLYDF